MFNNPAPKKKLRLHNLTPVQMICASFAGAILIGTLLLILPISSRAGVFTPVADALFTATSATCVTGLIIYDTYLYWSFFGQLVILGLIQVGGLGLVTLTSFFTMIIGRKLGLRSMELAKESINGESFADVKRMIRTVMTVTFITEAVGALLLAITFVPKYGSQGVFTSIFLSISAFCNAGFDILGHESEFASLTNYACSPMVYLPISLLVVFGGLGFAVWRELYHYRTTKTLSLHSRLVLVMTGLLVAVGTVGFCAAEWNNPETLGQLSFLDKLGAGYFQSVTTRTAGFNSIDQAALTDLSKLLSIALMFIGAAPGSTGGGIKVTTIAVVVMTIVSVMRGHDDTIIAHRTVEKKAVYKSMTLFFLALLLVVGVSMLIHFALDGDAAVIDIVFEEVSALGTVGLSAGVTAQLGSFGRFLLALSMYLGRVGPLSMIISLAMRSGSHKEVLPQGKIIIG